MCSCIFSPVVLEHTRYTQAKRRQHPKHACSFHHHRRPPYPQPPFKVFGGEGDDATGEIKGAFAHMLDTSTLGRVTAPRSASAVVNVKLGKDMMWKNWRNEPQASKRCPVDDLSAAAIKEVEKEQDFDVDVYDFHMFFLPDDNDVNRQSCTFYGMAENGCGTLDILPLSIGLNRRGQKRAKCKSWYFSDSRATLAHELTHNLVGYL